MSAAALPKTPPVAKGKPPQEPGEPKILGETRFDQVTSGLASSVFAAGLVVGWLYLILVTNGGLDNRSLAKVTMLDVFAGGGGEPEGEEGSVEAIDTGAEPKDLASNNEADAAEFEEPQLQQVPETLLDAVVDAAQQSADAAPAMDQGALIAKGLRASRVGTGGPALGEGAGEGGIAAHLRWSILYTPGQSVDDYARQLDFLRVELGVILNNRLELASRFSNPTPSRRTLITGIGENRIYFIWRGKGRKQADVGLLKKAGLEIGDADVIQFYPKDVEQTLAQLEVQYKGLSTTEIRSTVFRVVPAGDTYRLQVESQVPLRAPRGG